MKRNPTIKLIVVSFLTALTGCAVPYNNCVRNGFVEGTPQFEQCLAFEKQKLAGVLGGFAGQMQQQNQQSCNRRFRRPALQIRYAKTMVAQYNAARIERLAA